MFIRPADVPYFNAYYGSLVGCTVTAAEIVEEDGELWPTITLRHPDGAVFECPVSQDPEGNGPGFLFGLPSPERSST